LLHFHRLAAARHAEAAAKYGYVLRDQRHLAGEIARQHITGLQIEELRQRNRGASEDRGELDLRILHLLPQAHHPALVLLDAVAGDTRIEYLAQRLDHRVGHGHVQVAAGAVELDVEAGDDHDLRRRDDVGEVRVDLRVEVLELDGGDVRPRFAQVREDAAQHDVNDALLGCGELPPLDLRVPAGTAEEVVDHREHQLRVEHHERRAAEGVDLHEVEARRHVQRVHVLAEFPDLDRADGDLRRAPQQVVEADAVETGETLVDHLERGHPPAHDPHLGVEIVGTGLTGLRRRLGADRTRIDAVYQGVDLGLVENLLLAHGDSERAAYCITKLVKYTASTRLGSPPACTRSLR